jgi:hypothetical protein
LGFFDQCVCYINHSFNSNAKLLSDHHLVIGDLLTTNNNLMCISSMGSQVCKNSSNRVSHGTIRWIVNKPPKPIHFAHYHYLDPIWINCNIF